MYLPSHFEETRPEPLREIVQAFPLGLLVMSGSGEDAGPVANALPFLLDPEPTADGPHGTLVCHVARANPLWREADGRNVLVVFQGSQGYISPNWYAGKAEHGKVVPTWNYAMVQARGRLQAQDDPAAVREIVTRLTQRHEASQPRPWAVADAPPDFTETMLRAIVGIRIPLQSLVGKLKLSQNRPAVDMDGVAKGLRAGGSPSQQALAESMDKAAAIKGGA
jgi:transcriptional regulator